MNRRSLRTHSRGSRRPWGRVIPWVMLLCVPPAGAIVSLSPGIGWPYLAGLSVLMSIFSYAAYRSDKRRAEAGNWRIPESTLHFFDLMGGWPGGLIAQRQYRHKTAKVSFQTVFWLTVVAYQYAAIDLLLRGAISAYLAGLVRATFA